MKVAVIGGGAAGFFSALSVKQHHSDADVTIFEKSQKLLSKVKVSGGGRCNVTHDELNIKKLSTHYPRGEKFLRKAFSQFAVADTIQWFEERGVALKTEADHRMFPKSNVSQTIIDTFLAEASRNKIKIVKGTTVRNIQKGERLILEFSDDQKLDFDAVIVAVGGQKGYKFLDVFKKLGHAIEDPVPSLFTFNITNSDIMELMGLVADPVQVKIQGTKLVNKGPLLVTHWGMSGPAILKLSALGARELALKNYEFKIQVNWLGDSKEDEVRTVLNQYVENNGKKKVNKNPFDVPNRLWTYFLKNLQINPEITWNTLDKKSKNRIVNKITNDVYEIYKKTTFKEEFMTCGGIALNGVNPQTMQSRHTEGLYFSGEFLDIDGVTGGFNFQAAWTTGFIAGKLNS
ncbi:NAD(P)/FAD-dependent oxidoreductase [bacterium SCSIO 12643]|nr:NAD(P)/FAD-dependent oxidoreductase [bacterium SCSIO 12643]